MASLSLSFLGPFQALLDGKPLAPFHINKVQALLAYLATEEALRPGAVHRREAVMALLWPGMPQPSAQHNLRQTIYRLRLAILQVAMNDGEGTVLFLLADRQMIEVNPAAAYQLDVATFTHLLGRAPAQPVLEQAVALYQGDFLADFYLSDSSEYEAWAAARREQLRRQMLDALHSLTKMSLERGGYDQAETYARRQLEIDNFTDIEGSTPLWERNPEGMKVSLAKHNAILQQAISVHGGQVFKIIGDAFQAAFVLPHQALLAAVEAQRALAAEQWGTTGQLQVRMGLHTGSAEAQGRDYATSHTLNRAARVMSAGHGGQILLSLAVAELAHNQLPAEVQLRDLGEHRLKGLAHAEHLLQLVVPGLLNDFPPLQSVDVPRHNLPPQATPFIGREAELAAIGALIATGRARLITIVGPGGMGKTRLALAVAEQQFQAMVEAEARFPHGIYFISLAPLTSNDQIVPALADALSFQFLPAEEGARTPKQQLLDYLQQKRLLLIFDNFEHLVDAARPEDGVELLAEILQAAPEGQLLVTSRERLQVQREQLYPIGGLSYPDRARAESVASDVESKAYTAMGLFVQSARRLQPNFSLAAGDWSDLSRICRLVDGMPLALELAAAWVDVLSLAEIALEIEASLDFLEAELRDLPERHRAMRAVFDSTWQRLSEAERETLSQLSVFRGGCTRQAAQEVTGASLKVLAALANKSLLPYSKENGRYRIHELLRQYAAEKLARDPAREATTRDRHSAHYCALLQEQEAHLKGLQQQAALAAIQADIDNAMAAWHWAAEQGHVARLAQAIEGLGIFFEWRGRYQEGESTYRAAAEKMAAIKAQSPSAPADGLRLWARLLTWQSVYSGALGQSEPAREQLQRSLALLDTAELAGNDTRWEKAFARLQMGYNMVDSNPEAASRLAGQSLALYRALEDRWGSAQALVLLGESAWHLGDFEEATQLNQESLALRRALGDQRGIADSLAALGRDSWPQGGSEEGERVLRESIAIRRQIGEQAGLAEGLTILGCSLSLLGKVAEAVSVLEEGMAIYKNLGNAEGLAASNSLLGMVETGLGRYKRSHAHLKTGLTIAREIGNEKRIGEALKDLAELALVEEAYQEALQLAQEVLIMGMAKSGYATLRASTVALQGFAYLGLADTRRARQCLQEALQIVTRIRSFIPLHEIIALSGLLLLNRGETERAIELFALWSRYPHVANSRWFEDVAGRHVAAAAATLPPEIVEAARARGQARDLWETVAELLAELEDTRAWQEG